MKNKLLQQLIKYSTKEYIDLEEGIFWKDVLVLDKLEKHIIQLDIIIENKEIYVMDGYDNHNEFITTEAIELDDDNIMELKKYKNAIELKLNEKKLIDVKYKQIELEKEQEELNTEIDEDDIIEYITYSDLSERGVDPDFYNDYAAEHGLEIKED